MLGLKLRPEFAGSTITGTVVNLNPAVSDSFLNLSTRDALEITYPSVDLLQALEGCFGPNAGRCLVIMGERGQGKSHILGVIHHAYKDPKTFMSWIEQWRSKASYEAKISLPPSNFLVITAALHEQEYEFLWSPLFKNHPEGQRLEGKWEAKRETIPVPSKQDIVEALQKKPVTLILDEFQTWYENLSGKAERWAFTFTQILSEIAKDRPDLLRLVVSVRNGERDSYQQIHRLSPVLVNFQGAASKQDRQKLLIHRLFANRGQISAEQIKGLIAIYFSEWCRLLNKQGSETASLQDQMVAAWPFSLDLLQVIDEQIMVATHAQETRDLIKILAHLFRGMGEREPILTPAHFGLDEHGHEELSSLIAAVATSQVRKLAQFAKQNVNAVREALKEACPPFTERALASLYVRSLSMARQKGATREQIQADLSVGQKFDDNVFRDQWAQVAEHSYNVHERQSYYYFDIPENARTKVLAYARNPKLFEQGQDIEKIMLALEFSFAPKSSSDRERFRWTVLGKQYRDYPLHAGAFRGKHPSQDLSDGQPCYVFIPEALENGELKSFVRSFLSEHVQRYKNLVRFAVPNRSIYSDSEILLYARALYFADHWKSSEPEYESIARGFAQKLEDALSQSYKKVLILEKWDHTNPNNIQFAEIPIEQKAFQAFAAVDEVVSQSLFSPDEFGALVEDAVKSNHLERQKLSSLRALLEEPSPFPRAVIPWTNSTHIFDVILLGVMDGHYALQTNGGLVQVSSSRPREQIRREVQKPQWNRWDSMHVVGLAGGGSGVGIPAGEPTPPSGPFAPAGTPGPGAAPVPGGTGFGNPVSRIVKSLGYAQKPLDALGTIERWGLPKDATLHDVSIVFPDLTVEELRKLLQAMDGTVRDHDLNLSLLVKDENPK